MATETLISIVGDFSDADLDNLIRPDATDPRTTAKNIAEFLLRFVDGSIAASAGGATVTLGYTYTGTAIDWSGDCTSDYELDLD